MAAEFTFNRNINAGQPYEPPQSMQVVVGDRYIEIEMALPDAQKLDPNCAARFELLASPDGIQPFTTGFAFGWHGPFSIPPELVAEYLARPLIWIGTTPPQGWFVKGAIYNTGSVRINGTFTIRTSEVLTRRLGA